jgi:transcription initiation factor TFIIIB Brf1 subunit/transcription initiation factor TFIIB
MAAPELLLPALDAPTPSARGDGGAPPVPPAVEAAYRAFGCELIAEMAVLLRMPQACAATAQSLLQRFYHRRGLAAFDAHHVAMAALFLAGKVEENTRRMRDVLNVCYACRARRTAAAAAASGGGGPAPAAAPRTLVLGGELYTTWKAALIRTERFLLKELGFSVYAVSEEHPHKFVLYYVRALGGGPQLAQAAWAYLNDSLRTDACVRHRSEAIACAALYLAARDTGFALPKAVPWAAVFSSSSSSSSGSSEVEDIAARILARVHAPRAGWLPSLRPGGAGEGGT